MNDPVDVLIVGAGLSGIGAAVHLSRDCPDRSYAIVEARDAIGGTWDLFRYPGIRSDSDMHTLGYVFKPWTQAKAIADGPSILDYVRETADEYGITEKIRFGHEVVGADWDSQARIWTVRLRVNDEERTMRCRFLFMNAGYYDYEEGHRPEFPAMKEFCGSIVYPQHWPEDLDYAGRRIIVIGSGATAVTLVPELAKDAAHVTMLQRSPTYIVARPAEDGIANFLRRYLPAKAAYRITRWKNVLLQNWFFKRAREKPGKVKAKLLDMAREELGPHFDIETHLTPRYNPWDQRLCLIPDSDLWEALRDGGASIETDQIETFTETGIQLKSGKHLNADIIVSATGLKLRFLANMDLSLDGRPFDVTKSYPYKGVMYAGLPNYAATFGYTNASWTLKADITAQYVCRLLNYMKAEGHEVATPVMPPETIEDIPYVDFSSGYFQRALHLFPKQKASGPWRQPHDYINDRKMLLKAPVDDGTVLWNEVPETPALADTAVRETVAA